MKLLADKLCEGNSALVIPEQFCSNVVLEVLMDVSSAGLGQTSNLDNSSAELRAAKLAKSQQEAEGKAAVELLQSAEVSPPRSADLAVGQNINIKV